MFNLMNLPKSFAIIKSHRHIHRLRELSKSYDAQLTAKNNNITNHTQTPPMRKYICAVLDNTTTHAIIDTYQLLVKYNFFEGTHLSYNKSRTVWNAFLSII